MKFLINISKKYKNYDYYKDCFKDLFERKAIKTIVFCENMDLENTEFCEFRKYLDFADLEKQISEIGKQNIFYINTFDEKLVTNVNILKKNLLFAVTEKFEIFRNKDLQRKYLLEKFPETTVNYQEIDFTKEQEIFINFPCVLKPTSSAQSSGVTFLKSFDDYLEFKGNLNNLKQNLENRGYSENKFILEEFIDGQMYTANYFVNDFGEIFHTPIVKVNGVKNLGIDDFSNYVRISEEYFSSEINKKDIYDFVKKHVETFGIKNTFVFHDFKINSRGELKTIELNGRIGGYRLELNKEVYDFNMFDLISGEKNFKTDFFYSAFVFYPDKEGIFKGFNEEILKKFKKMESFLSLNKNIGKIGKMIGLTKNGYSSVASMKIKHLDENIFKKDFDFVVENYKKVLIVE